MAIPRELIRNQSRSAPIAKPKWTPCFGVVNRAGNPGRCLVLAYRQTWPCRRSNRIDELKWCKMAEGSNHQFKVCGARYVKAFVMA